MSVAALVAAACVSLSGSHITAGDLARALPGFVPADAAAVVAWSPLPGAVRVFHAAELRRLLAPLDTSVGVPDAGICFEFKLAPLAEAAVVEAMRRALPADSTIDVVEFSRIPAPAGEIVFARESLASPVSPDAPALWRGFVRYGDNAKFQIWARVKVRVPVTRLVAIEVLRQGVPIRATQVKLATFDDAPSNRVTPATEAIAVGYIPRRNIAANTPVWADSLDPPMEIVKGDRVAVTVHSGLAVLSLNVEAMTSGRLGDAISLKNPSSGKLFRARIDGPNAASVQVDPVNP
jgi:flagella basal body P-ring formation protein FlgA